MRNDSRNNYEGQNKKLIFADTLQRFFSRKRRIIILAGLLAIVGLFIWDISDPPLWWQFERRLDKQAILQYAKNQYNGKAKVTGSKFPMINPGLVGSPEESVMYFEYDGANFAISARNGRLIFDGYYVAKAESTIKKIIDDGFFQPRNIDVKYRCSFSKELLVDLEDFDGSVVIVINFDEYDPQGKPHNIEWFYDFYLYWINSSEIKDFGIQINYYISDNQYYQLNFNETSQFNSSDEFYAEFQYVSYDNV